MIPFGTMTQEQIDDAWQRIVRKLRRMVMRGTAEGPAEQGRFVTQMEDEPGTRTLTELGADGVKLYPKKGARVLVTSIEGTMSESWLLAADELERIELSVGGMLVTVRDGKLMLGGQGRGGLVEVQGLVQALNGLEQYANQVATMHNVLITALGAVPMLQPFAPTFAPAMVPNLLVPTLRQQLENGDVVH